MTPRDYRARWRRRMQAKGCCRNCGSDALGGYLCPRCAGKKKVHQAAYREKRRAGRPAPVAEPSPAPQPPVMERPWWEQVILDALRAAQTRGAAA